MYFPLFQGIVINVHSPVPLLVHKPCSPRYHQLKHSWSICPFYSHQNIFNSMRPPVNGFSHLYFPKAIKPAFSQPPFIPLGSSGPQDHSSLTSHFFTNSLSKIGWAPLASDPQSCRAEETARIVTFTPELVCFLLCLMLLSNAVKAAASSFINLFSITASFFSCSFLNYMITYIPLIFSFYSFIALHLSRTPKSSMS